MYSLQIIDEAKAELRHELSYSRKKWGDIHAKQYAKEIRAKINSLRTTAKEHQEHSHVLSGIRILNYRGNRIIYTILEEQSLVVVLAILGNAKNIDSAELSKRRQHI